jgi:hypothetical protein
MKSLARPSLARLAATLSAAGLGAFCLGGVAVAAPATRQLPAAGDGFAVTLAASSAYATLGQSVTLTATTNTDVGPTPYYITIYSETTGADLATCGSGITCTATVTQAIPGTQVFEAFVGDDVPGNGHPGFALVASNEVRVGWWFILRLGPGLRGLAPVGQPA